MAVVPGGSSDLDGRVFILRRSVTPRHCGVKIQAGEPLRQLDFKMLLEDRK
jgi:hypothetical protein